MDTIADSAIYRMVEKLNSRLRKCLCWKMPYKVFFNRVWHLIWQFKMFKKHLVGFNIVSMSILIFMKKYKITNIVDLYFFLILSTTTFWEGSENDNGGYIFRSLSKNFLRFLEDNREGNAKAFTRKKKNTVTYS